MTAYTIANLDVEARFGRSHLDSEHLGVTYIRYGPGVRSPMGHSHREQEEIYVVLGGSGRIKLGDDIVALRRWDAVRGTSTRLRERSRRGFEPLLLSGVAGLDGGNTC